MSGLKSITVDDQNGSIVTAVEHPFNKKSVRLLVSGLNTSSVEQAFLYVDDARRLGEWLVAWAKEQGPECYLCHRQVLHNEAKAVGQDFAHDSCILDQTAKRGTW